MAKKDKKIDWRIGITALICLTIIQCVAMYFGINGTFRALVAALIAGIVGVTVKNPFSNK